ncbi:MAG: helix-turn-helix domain-containing protein [Bacteroidales bacterium]|nr:helix-turn-helix domain-containing protein [Bacteroidales bacterium]HPE86711.1 helix-turn-helix domain-containing protein [Bacteroidales bacterium]
MKPIYFLPGKHCSSLIKKYEYLKSEETVHIIDRYIPRGDAALVFNLEGAVHVRKENGEREALPEYFVTPNVMQPLIIEVSGKMKSIIAICYASRLSRLLSISLKPIPGKNFITLDSVPTTNLVAQLRLANDPKTMIALFESYLSSTCLMTSYIPDTIDKIYDSISAHAVLTPLKEITGLKGENERSLRRKFLNRTGVSAKTLSRIIRVNYLWDQVEKKEAVNYQDLVFEGKYFDQAHFIKDFKSILGETPGQFFRRNRENVKLISGK